MRLLLSGASQRGSSRPRAGGEKDAGGMKTPRGRNQSFPLEEEEASFNYTQAAPKPRPPFLGSCLWCCCWCQLYGQRQHLKPFLYVASSLGSRVAVRHLPISPDPQTHHLPSHPNTFTHPVLLASLPPCYQLCLCPTLTHPSCLRANITSSGKPSLINSSQLPALTAPTNL